MLSLMAPELRSPLMVAAHDAGAANLIIGWMRGRSSLEIRTCLAGPAVDLWTTAFGKPQIMTPYDALLGAEMLISGTSYASNLEHQARILAKERGIKSIGVIDHWVNYPSRFLRDGSQVLPDEIWVTDEDALAIANDCFPMTPVRQQPNLYLAAQANMVRAFDNERSSVAVRRVLYALEPIRHTWAASGIAGEFQSLDYFIRHGRQIGLDARTKIRLRPHPSEPHGKYDNWLAQNSNWDVEMDPNNNLAESISWADTVVGCETYAMVVGLAAGRYVVSSLPAHAPRCRLPQKAIIHLSDLKLSNLNEHDTD